MDYRKKAVMIFVLKQYFFNGGIFMMDFKKKKGPHLKVIVMRDKLNRVDAAPWDQTILVIISEWL